MATEGLLSLQEPSGVQVPPSPTRGPTLPGGLKSNPALSQGVQNTLTSSPGSSQGNKSFVDGWQYLFHFGVCVPSWEKERTGAKFTNVSVKEKPGQEQGEGRNPDG